MRNMKRFAALLLTGMLAFAAPVSTWAAGSITIASKTGGHQYRAYKLFGGTQKDGNLEDIVWGNGVKADALLSALKADTVTINGESVTNALKTDFASCTTAEGVANVLKLYGDNSEKLAFFAKIVAGYLADSPSYSTRDGVLDGTDGKYKYNLNVDDGYYFVDDVLISNLNGNSRTSYILHVAGTQEYVNAKTDAPSVTKKVKENNDALYKDTWNDAADFSIDQPIEFRLAGYVPDMSHFDTYYYEFQDTLTESLTFDATSVKVYIEAYENMAAANGFTGTHGAPISSNYYALQETTNGFKVIFPDLKANWLHASAGDYVIVEYKASLNEKAVIGNPGNPNEVKLVYSNNPNNTGNGTSLPGPTPAPGTTPSPAPTPTPPTTPPTPPTTPPGDTGETPKDEVVIFTFDIPVKKIIKGTETPLSGAEFALYANEENAKAAALNPTQDNLNLAIPFTFTDGKYKHETEFIAATMTRILKDTNGAYAVEGLDQGTYYLVETKEPTGYNRLTVPEKIEIVTTYDGTAYVDGHVPDATEDQLKDYKLKLNGADEQATEVKIGNSHGTVLPETGGMGLTIIYVVGGICIVGASVLLFTRKRMASR